MSRKTLVIYLVAEPETPALALAAVEGGADIIELGIPFSDPLAEGPTIRRASERALSRGMRTQACLDVLTRMRELMPDTPIVPMTYAAILEAYGYDRFAADARERGASSFILVDLPVEEHPALRRIQLVAPTSTEERIRAATEATDGWLYLVTVTGTTGARTELSPALAPLVERVRNLHGMAAAYVRVDAPEAPVLHNIGVALGDRDRQPGTRLRPVDEHAVAIPDLRDDFGHAPHAPPLARRRWLRPAPQEIVDARRIRELLQLQIEEVSDLAPRFDIRRERGERRDGDEAEQQP